MKKSNHPFDEASQEIRNLSSMPVEKLIDHLSEIHKDVKEVAPHIAIGINGVALRAVQYLGSKLPNNSEIFMDGDLQASKAQKDKWMETYDIVNDPLTIIEKMKDRTITLGDVDAIHSVYPELSEAIKAKIQGKLGQMNVNKEVLPYPLRLSISKFLGVPLDSTMTQQSRASIIGTSTNNISETQGQSSGGKAPKAKKPGSASSISQVNKVNSIYPTSLQARQLENQKVGK